MEAELGEKKITKTEQIHKPVKAEPKVAGCISLFSVHLCADRTVNISAAHHQRMEPHCNFHCSHSRQKQ